MKFLKRFLDGLIFGAGFAIALIAIWSVATWYVIPMLMTGEMMSFSDPEEEVPFPPEISRSNEFLGSTGSYSGDFSHEGSGVLSSGPGQIVGTAMVDGGPVVGLRLRLALNGSVMSQWATTDATGRYEIAVPFGDYRIDGFELDFKTANSVLPGKIRRPRMPFSTDEFEVAAAAPGHGLDLEFVDPVVLDLPKNKFSIDEEIVIRWQPYPGAQEYMVQIFGNSNEQGYGKSASIFPWSERPLVTEPRINLADYDVELKAGHYYKLHIEAKAGDSRPISRNASRYAGNDFEVVE